MSLSASFVHWMWLNERMPFMDCLVEWVTSIVTFLCTGSIFFYLSLLRKWIESQNVKIWYWLSVINSGHCDDCEAKRHSQGETETVMPDNAEAGAGGGVSHWTKLSACCCCISLETGTRLVGAVFLLISLGEAWKLLNLLYIGAGFRLCWIIYP